MRVAHRGIVSKVPGRNGATAPLPIGLGLPLRDEARVSEIVPDAADGFDSNEAFAGEIAVRFLCIADHGVAAANVIYV